MQKSSWTARLSPHLIAWVLVLGLPAIGIYWFLGGFSGTSVHFQSSDGHWQDSEVLFKGRQFRHVLPLFENYRSVCAPRATLQRTTGIPPWYKIEHWFNDYSDPKWAIPYAERVPYSKAACRR